MMSPLEKQKLMKVLRETVDDETFRLAMDEIGRDRLLEMFEHLRDTIGGTEFDRVLRQGGGAEELLARAMEQELESLQEPEPQASSPSRSWLLWPEDPTIDKESDDIWQREIQGVYPFLSWRSPIHVPYAEELRRGMWKFWRPPFYVLYKLIQEACFQLEEKCPGLLIDPPRKGGWLLRQTPKILVCMPFDVEAAEITYQLVLRPLIRRFFGGKCIRCKHRTLGDWRKEVRKQMLYCHLTIFDLSFDNQNVQTEKRYFDQLEEHFYEKSQISIHYIYDRPSPNPERQVFYPTVAHESLAYDCTDADFRDLAAALRERVESELSRIGFKKGRVDPWVVYPQPPPPGVHMIGSPQEAEKIREQWINQIRIDRR